MPDITGETLGIGAGVITLLLVWFKEAIKAFFNTRTNMSKDNAEKSIYEILTAENSRMAVNMAAISIQLNALLVDNNRLLNRVGELERVLQGMPTLEAKIRILELELAARDACIIEKDIAISELKKRIENV